MGAARKSVSRMGQSKPSPMNGPVATTSSGVWLSAGSRRAMAWRRAVAVMPPRRTRVEVAVVECFGEPLDVAGPLGKDQAVPSTFQGRDDVGDDLAGAGV